MTGRTGLPTGRCLTHRPARAGLSRRRSGSCRGRVIQAGTFAAVYRAAPAGAAGEAAPRPYRGYRVRSRCAYRVLRRMHTTAAAIDACGGAARPPSGRGQAAPDPPAWRAGRGHRRRPTMVVPLRWQPGYRSPVLPRRSARRARQRLAPTNGMFILTAGDSGDGVATVPPSRRGQAVPDPPVPRSSNPHHTAAGEPLRIGAGDIRDSRRPCGRPSTASAIDARRRGGVPPPCWGRSGSAGPARTPGPTILWRGHADRAVRIADTADPRRMGVPRQSARRATQRVAPTRVPRRALRSAPRPRTMHTPPRRSTRAGSLHDPPSCRGRALPDPPAQRAGIVHRGQTAAVRRCSAARACATLVAARRAAGEAAPRPYMVGRSGAAGTDGRHRSGDRPRPVGVRRCLTRRPGGPAHAGGDASVVVPGNVAAVPHAALRVAAPSGAAGRGSASPLHGWAVRRRGDGWPSPVR